MWFGYGLMHRQSCLRVGVKLDNPSCTTIIIAIFVMCTAMSSPILYSWEWCADMWVNMLRMGLIGSSISAIRRGLKLDRIIDCSWGKHSLSLMQCIFPSSPNSYEVNLSSLSLNWLMMKQRSWWQRMPKCNSSWHSGCVDHTSNFLSFLRVP